LNTYGKGFTWPQSLRLGIPSFSCGGQVYR
jgi:hypothetical protein